MSLKSSESKLKPDTTKYTPYNLCCVLEELFGRCTVCHRDFCKHCFFTTHSPTKRDMYCGTIRLYWKNMNLVVSSDPSKLELWPTIND